MPPSFLNTILSKTMKTVPSLNLSIYRFLFLFTSKRYNVNGKQAEVDAIPTFKGRAQRTYLQARNLSIIQFSKVQVWTSTVLHFSNLGHRFPQPKN